MRFGGLGARDDGDFLPILEATDTSERLALDFVFTSTELDLPEVLLL